MKVSPIRTEKLNAELMRSVEEFLRNSTLSGDDVQECIEEALHGDIKRPSIIYSPISVFTKTLTRYISGALKFIVVIAALGILICNHVPAQKFVLRHSQAFIYPFMREVRLWTMPILKKFEYLNELYDEQCLVENPFYTNKKLECWPCETIRNVVDLTDFKLYSRAYTLQERPFVLKDILHETVNLNLIRNEYLSNKHDLTKGTARFYSFFQSNGMPSLEEFWMSPERYFTANDEFQAVWKMHRVSAARVIRRTFPRPYFVPNSSEVSLQRFIFFDGPEANQYRLPLTEFANVWLAQVQGYRMIVLDPSEDCRKNCSTVAVMMRPQTVLYYNWQFYRPRSLPARMSKLPSIMYMGSFY